MSRLRVRGPLPQAFALALTAALLSSMHARVYDVVFLFLAVTLGEWKRPATIAAAAWAISPVAYLLPYALDWARIAPALTVLVLWLSLWSPRCSESSPAPGEYQTV